MTMNARAGAQARRPDPVIVAEMLERRVKDPRLGFVTVTDARVTGDLQEATVFYTVLGTPRSRPTPPPRWRAPRAAALRGRQADRPAAHPDADVRRRRVPENAAHIDDLLARARAADAEVAAARRGRGVRRRGRPVPRQPSERRREADDGRAGGRRRRRPPGRVSGPGPVTAAGGLVVVDKPAGLTSHDVVARVRRLAGTRKVGHAGTLDPMATGVLVLGVERATRLLGHLALTDKAYTPRSGSAQATVTDDAEGEVTASARPPRA